VEQEINSECKQEKIMELKELCEKTLEMFDISRISDLENALWDAIEINNFLIYQKFVDLVKDLSVDWLQMIFQYYEADRKDKKQDYTPKTLAETVAKLSEQKNEKTVLDMCAGSGALTIQKWNSNHNLEFICMEYDEKVIPYLIFNLAIRNINATVLFADVLSNEIFRAFSLKRGDRFSTVKETATPTDIKADTCISNPPYNMKWTHPIFASLQSRFVGYELPPESNANYAFVLTALHYVDKATFILPNGILSDNDAIQYTIRKILIEQNLIDSVILNPDNMFEATTIPTCLITFKRNRTTTKISMLDMRKNSSTEQRVQNGQRGGKSHTNRAYVKEINTYNSDCQKLILDTLREKLEEIPEFFKQVTLEELRKNDYVLIPSRYLAFSHQEPVHRPYQAIFRDYNNIVNLKNELKITINESLAKQLGFDVDNHKESIKNSREIKNNNEKLFDIPIECDNYISFSKNKNELKIEQKGKTGISVLLHSFLKSWAQHIAFLNNQENIYLAELRDAMLPDLMSGKIDVSKTQEQEVEK
jgi:type I restriction-modification system DNA methylase subunit